MVEEELEKKLVLMNIDKLISSEELVEEQRQVLRDYYKFIVGGGSRAKSLKTFRNIFRNLSIFARQQCDLFSLALSLEDILC